MLPTLNKQSTPANKTKYNVESLPIANRTLGKVRTENANMLAIRKFEPSIIGFVIF